MPNGQTDVFGIPRESLIAMLSGHDECAFKGFQLAEKVEHTYALSELAELVLNSPEDTIQVEVQYGDQYILHVGEKWEHWVEVGPSEALHSRLRRYRASMT